jgi:hypothetical protein
MKFTQKCPKCNGTEISHLEGTKAPLMKIRTGVTSNAIVSLYICLTCGYCEPWIDSKIDLSDVKTMYPPRK